jgi:outer membrane immunogenic protein
MRRLMMLPLLSGTFFLGGLSDGIAADMPMPPLASPVLYAPAPYSWTGFYVGGNFGGDWDAVSETVTTASGTTGSLSGNLRGLSGGGQIGINWQVIQPVVIGLESDLQGQAPSGSRSINGVVGATTITGFTNSPYFGSVRGRAGYAYGTLLFYGTAGVVYGDIKLSGTSSPPVSLFDSSANFWSWTAGAGIEAALGGPYSIKFEYLFIGSPSSWPVIPGQTGQTVTSGTNLIRAGVNYRF